LGSAVGDGVDGTLETQKFFAVWAAFFKESLRKRISFYKLRIRQQERIITACVCTIEQTMQALKFLCWFGGTKFVDMVGRVIWSSFKRITAVFGG
jgi:hypothetical protein